ncbi:MAG: hypothetical protein K9I74_03940 [Bacteroidales bacterium]|nr:hypothetical protein [Bacteroidales bacterium]
MKILFFIKVKEDFTFLRSDFNLLARNLIEEGNNVYAYDVKKLSFFDLNRKEKTRIFKFSFFERANLLRIIAQYFALLKLLMSIQKDEYDFFQFNYIRHEYLLLPKRYLKKAKYSIARVYGSDINRRDFIKNNFRKFYKEVNIIHFSYNKLIKTFEKYHSKSCRNKYYVLPPPNLNLAYIIENKYSRDEAKNIIGVDINTVVIHCGTNSSSIEQHYKILEAIKDIIDHVNVKIKYVFHLSHRNNSNIKYISNFRKKLENVINKDELIIIDQYLEIDKLNLIRYATDIFINIREYDQMVGSMLEYFATGAQVLTGHWLNYNKFIEMNGFYVNYINNENELRDKLIELINKNSFQISKNERIIREVFNINSILKRNKELFYNMYKTNE